MNQHIKSLWLTETIRLIEQDSGTFQDDEANRQAKMLNSSIRNKLIKRAEILAEQNGLPEIQHQYLKASKFSFIILCCFAIITGAGLAFSALSQNPVNLYWALFSLLGIHFITLILWAISFFFMPNDSGSFLVQIWSWLIKKFLKQHVEQLPQAFMILFGRKIRWLVGFIANLLWLIILLSALIFLMILLTTQHYSFEWQSTLLSRDSVVYITQLLGHFPALLGFSLPDVETIRISDQASTDSSIRSAWAIWLLGIFIVYGIFIRLMLVIICGLKWGIGCQQMSLNLHHPEYQYLLDRLQNSAEKVVIDREINQKNAPNDFSTLIGKDNFLVAIDIEENWLPPEEAGQFLGFLNSAQQRKNILDYLQQNPAKKLLIAIDPDRAPDRGIMNLLKTLMSKSNQSKIWFIHSTGRQMANWQSAMQSLSLDSTELVWLLEDK